MEKRAMYKRDIIILVLVLLAGMIMGGLFFGRTADIPPQTKAASETIWTCSMHPQIRQSKPGQCPICAMDLIPLSSEPSAGENMDPNEIFMSEAAIKLGNIQTTVVKRGKPEKKIFMLGKVQADERNIAQLTARFAGRIEELYINYTGQTVAKGQKLASIYSPDLITAQKELLEAVKFKSTNSAFYNASRSKLRLWNLSNTQINSIENSNEPIIRFDLFAPIAGTVSKRHVSSGDYIKEGTALFELIDLSRVWVLFDVYESDLPWIRLGDKVTFSLQSNPGKTYTGPIRFIDPFIDSRTRVTQIRVEIPNPKQKLKPEMFASGVLESVMDMTAEGLLVPKSAILWTGKRSVVYVKVTDRKSPSFLYREIVLGPEAGNFYIVTEGLMEGEEIAVNGVFKIDASAQLAGKTSMMNPVDGQQAPGHQHRDLPTLITHEMFKVYGNCEMCKDRIEKTALNLNGVTGAEWSIETKMLHVTFDPEKTDLTTIHKAIAAVGHDTDIEKAPDTVYNALPGCCLYRK